MCVRLGGNIKGWRSQLFSWLWTRKHFSCSSLPSPPRFDKTNKEWIHFILFIFTVMYQCQTVQANMKSDIPTWYIIAEVRCNVAVQPGIDIFLTNFFQEHFSIQVYSHTPGYGGGAGEVWKRASEQVSINIFFWIFLAALYLPWLLTSILCFVILLSIMFVIFELHQCL